MGKCISLEPPFLLQEFWRLVVVETPKEIAAGPSKLCRVVLRSLTLLGCRLVPRRGAAKAWDLRPPGIYVDHPKKRRWRRRLHRRRSREDETPTRC